MEKEQDSFEELQDDEAVISNGLDDENEEEADLKAVFDEEDAEEDTKGTDEDSDEAVEADEGADEADEEGAAEQDLSDEELDEVADAAIMILQDILKFLDVGEVTIDEYEGDEGELILDITGDDLAVLIGRHGKTLDALQTLVSAVTVRTMGFRYPIVIDVEGYKNRQRQKLESIARSAASRAIGQGKSIKLRPMTPYERRLVHIALRSDNRVDTASEGEGSSRHVVVIPR